MKFIQKHFKKVAIAFVVVVFVAAYFLFRAVGDVTVDPEVVKWLDSPVSELKVWHLLAILFFTSLLASK